MKNLFSIVLLMCLASNIMAQKGKLRSAQSALESGDYKSAYGLIIEASENDKTKDLPQTWVVMAQVLSQVKASPELGQIMQIQVSDEDLVNAVEKAQQLDANGDYSDQIMEAANIIAQNAHNAGVIAYNETKDFQKAIDNFEHEVAFREKYSLPIDTIDYLVIGASAYELGDQEKVLDAYNKLLDLNYQDKAIYYTLLQIYQDTEQDDNYLATIDKATQQFPNENNFSLMRIDYYLNKGQIDDILDQMIQEADNNPNNINLLLAISGAYEAKEDYPNQFIYAQRATEVDPSSYAANYNAGVAKFNQAVKYNSEMNFMSTNTSPEYMAAKQKRDQFADQAAPYFEKAYSIDPNNASILAAYVQFYRLKNDKAKQAEFQSKLDAAQ